MFSHTTRWIIFALPLLGWLWFSSPPSGSMDEPHAQNGGVNLLDVEKVTMRDRRPTIIDLEVVVFTELDAVSEASFQAQSQVSSSGKSKFTALRFGAYLEQPGLPIDFVPGEAIQTPISCLTPQSLMLHSAFGAQRMASLAQAIRTSGLKTMTYRDLAAYLDAGQCPPANALIVSIDDLGSRWLRPNFKAMIEVFDRLGMKLVLGVVVQGPQDQEVWNYLNGLDPERFEIASHSIHHYSLPRLSSEALDEEIHSSRTLICQFASACPMTLILPFGNIDQKNRVMEAASDYRFVIGIQGGRQFESDDSMFLGRIGPDNFNQDQTLTLLERSFQR